ncbi:hypothetical protein E2C01_031830 [Portunus trituberculatus]|uniref:Uncharacterized protein n=1 Tax=Portunus trituberculatus TaxID=210409 RepID=A0A5B7EY02_PORTR|nr:hypothetical protein [Portunus trituberculatus]
MTMPDKPEAMGRHCLLPASRYHGVLGQEKHDEYFFSFHSFGRLKRKVAPLTSHAVFIGRGGGEVVKVCVACAYLTLARPHREVCHQIYCN